MTTRRDLLASSAALSAVALLPNTAKAAAGVADPALGALLDRFVEEELAEAPEAATSLGLDTGARAGLKVRLSDYSQAGMQKRLAAYADRRRRLATVDRRRLQGSDAILWDTVDYSEGLGVEAARFPYGDNGSGGANPYVISQQNGALSGVPEFLNSQHSINTKADADAYIARLQQFGPAMDAEDERLRSDAGRGVIPPDFILKTALEQMTALRSQTASQTGLVTSLATRARAKGIAGDYTTSAARIVANGVFPALDRQIATVRQLQTRAGHDGGVWRLPQGEAYYAYALRAGTTTARTPADVHQLGLDQNAALEARMDALLRTQGLTQGTVGERTSALTKDPRFVYPDSDAGRAALLAYLNGRIAAIRPLLPRLSKLGLNANVQVKRVPPEIQAGAAQGYMNFAALDGSRPAIYYVNLQNMENWPRWTLASLTAHEAIPGHAWQGAYLAERRDQVPLIKNLMGFNAFVEGWALYAEQLVDEFGLYKDDPFGQLGYLQAQKFRASRLVVDTGLHSSSFRWSREKAIDWMIASTGRSRPAVTSEVDRYCASPGQACGYKVGHTEIVRLRAKAIAALGPKFDIRDYNDALVSTGGVPLTVLERVVDGYVAKMRV